MTKQQILNATGLTEDEFYSQYPDQETFCQDYPDMCPSLTQSEKNTKVDFLPVEQNQPMSILNSIVNKYITPKQLTNDSLPIPKLSPIQTMKNIGSANQTMQPEMQYAGFPQYKIGGNHWIQGAVKHPGRCTPGSPNYDCPKGSPQWRLAQTFKKHHGFHEEGGGVYETGGNIHPAMRAMYQKGGTYTIKKGDTLSNIASRNNMSLSDLLALNSLSTIGANDTSNKL